MNFCFKEGRKEFKRASIGVLGLTQMRMPHPSLGPREPVGKSSGGREASSVPGRAWFSLPVRAGVLTVGVFLSSLCQLEGRCNMGLGNSLYCVSRFSTSLLPWLTNSKTIQAFPCCCSPWGRGRFSLAPKLREGPLQSAPRAHVLWRPTYLSCPLLAITVSSAIPLL